MRATQKAKGYFALLFMPVHLLKLTPGALSLQGLHPTQPERSASLCNKHPQAKRGHPTEERSLAATVNQETTKTLLSSEVFASQREIQILKFLTQREGEKKKNKSLRK